MPLLHFDNRFVHELPGETEGENRPRAVQGICWSRVPPTPVRQPRLLSFSRPMADTLGLSEEDIRDPAFVAAMSGNRLLHGMLPFATCYGGHQFGHWAGQLGDGRAISLGEAINPAGERWELQLKGAGPTPYSRMADGRAVLRSSLREFVCSEAMHHLGIPTTRALTLCLTGEDVVRDMFYDGHPEAEPGAVVCRVSPSFTRFGHFEMLMARGETELLRRFTDFTIDRDFPDIAVDDPDRYAKLFHTVCERTALMVAHWMRVGFVHGVMNSDNMSILGLTIDYGPYGWLEDFDPLWTPNTTDAQGRRYCFGRQPEIAHWNLQCLARALSPLIRDQQVFDDGLAAYDRDYARHFRAMYADKLGIERIQDNDEPLVQDLFTTLEAAQLDMTLFFRKLVELDLAAPSTETVREAFYREDLREKEGRRVKEWLERYGKRVSSDSLPEALRREKMLAANPKYVFRNYLAQQAIDAAEAGDTGPLETLMTVLQRPCEEQPQHEAHAARRPEWARHRAGCSMLSCSS
ncbi:protein adenylyltransferase SelO [Natronospira bacteriovora]